MPPPTSVNDDDDDDDEDDDYDGDGDGDDDDGDDDDEDASTNPTSWGPVNAFYNSHFPHHITFGIFHLACYIQNILKHKHKISC